MTEGFSSTVNGRKGTVTSRQIAGVLLGVVGVALAVVGVMTDEVWIAAAAGPCAAAAASLTMAAEQHRSQVSRQIVELAHQLAISQGEVTAMQSQLEMTNTLIAETRATVTGLLEREPTTTATQASQVMALSDPESTLYSESYFRVALESRIASARRHLRPVAITLVKVGEGAGETLTQSADPVSVTAAIRQTLRDADTACRMNDGSYALILEDTPENGAVWTVERIRRNLNSRHGLHTMWAGVACYPAHAFTAEELLEQTLTALAAAQEWGQDRIEIAVSD